MPWPRPWATFAASVATMPRPSSYRASEGTRTPHEQIRAGRLPTVKQGRATLITATALADYVKLLEQEARTR